MLTMCHKPLPALDYSLNILVSKEQSSDRAPAWRQLPCGHKY